MERRMELIMYSLSACHKVLFTKLGLIMNLTLVILNSVQEQGFGVTFNKTILVQIDFL